MDTFENMGARTDRKLSPTVNLKKQQYKTWFTRQMPTSDNCSVASAKQHNMSAVYS